VGAVIKWTKKSPGKAVMIREKRVTQSKPTGLGLPGSQESAGNLIARSLRCVTTSNYTKYSPKLFYNSLSLVIVLSFLGYRKRCKIRKADRSLSFLLLSCDDV
jgi:hypothetical protein